MSKAKFDVIVVGGGFSGALLAIQLLRRAPNLSVAVIDKGSAADRGRGVAYGTKYSCHLLNVPARNMSALAEDPDHFLRWAQANYGSQVLANAFLPRLFYGRYIDSLVEEALGQTRTGSIQWIQGEVASVKRDESLLEVQLISGDITTAQTVVLAVGNFPPANLRIPGLSASSKRYVRSPWASTILQDIPKDGTVLLIGSGLTSVDVAVALKSEGFTGHIHILSRRGLMPQRHAKAGHSLHRPQWPQFWNEQSPRGIRGLLRVVRKQIQSASEAGSDWREVIDSLRPVTQNIWQSLSPVERKRFMRHVRSYWDVHRHRIAPEISDTIAQLVHDGQVILYAGRVTDYQEFPDYAEVKLRERKTRAEHTLLAHRVINCTGPETDCRRIDDPLIKNLLGQGFARPDPLFLGLDVDAKGALVDSAGVPSTALYVIGPARKGSLWETIAVPELRTQAFELAEHLALKSAQKAAL